METLTSLDPEYAALLKGLPELDALSDKVARVHGPGEPFLLALREQYLSLASDLDQLARRQGQAEAGLDAARRLRELRKLSGGYQPRANACRSYRGLYNGLASLDQAATPLLQRLAELEPSPQG